VVMIGCQCLCVLGDVGLKLCVVVVAVSLLCAVKVLEKGWWSVQAGVLLPGCVVRPCCIRIIIIPSTASISVYAQGHVACCQGAQGSRPSTAVEPWQRAEAAAALVGFG
jgi:hypothetical protein